MEWSENWMSKFEINICMLRQLNLASRAVAGFGRTDQGFSGVVSEKVESRSCLDGNVIWSTIVNEHFEIIKLDYGNTCWHLRDHWVL
jgi:hypothetical protein